MTKLTPKQQRFVDEYLFDLNATQAAIRAGYSPHTARQIADENLSKPYISAIISKSMAERSRRTGITNDRVLQELARIGFANAEDIINLDTGAVRTNATRDDTAAIQSVRAKSIPTEQGEITEYEVRLYDKLTLQHLAPPVFSGENELE